MKVLESKHARFALGIAFLLVLLAAVQLLFLLIQEKQGMDVRSAVTARIEKVEPPDSRVLLDQLAGFSKEGMIRCFQYAEAAGAVHPWSERNCEISPWWLDSASIELEILGANGKIWQIRFRSVNPGAFYIALWLMRALAVLSVSWMIFPRFMKNERIVQRKIGP